MDQDNITETGIDDDNAPLHLSAQSIRSKLQATTPTGSSFAERYQLPIAKADARAVRIVEQSRDPAKRIYDQIAMESRDLVRQARAIAPELAGKRVVFVGDYDGTARMLLALTKGVAALPDEITVLDFDQSVLSATRRLAEELNLGEHVTTQMYNVFDPIPDALRESFDWFYINPPYGRYNNGVSARLFLFRALELAKQGDAQGCVILPIDVTKEWTMRAMHMTQLFVLESGWIVTEVIPKAHGYVLDDDPELRSSSIFLRSLEPSLISRNRWYRSAVAQTDIPHFYGRSVLPPYPRYLNENIDLAIAS